jgi:hypothetical protein
MVVESLVQMGVDPKMSVDEQGALVEEPDLSVYKEEFERKLVEDTISFYSRESSRYNHNHTALQYINQVRFLIIPPNTQCTYNCL